MRRPLPFSPSMAALLVFLLGVLISALLFSAVRQLEQDKVDIDFRQHARVRVAAIQNGLNDSINVLRDVNQLFVAFDHVSREQFHSYTKPLLVANPYIQALNFHRYISAEERPQYEADMRLQFPGFTIGDISKGAPFPSPERARYRVVDYIEPMEGNQAALGIDVDSYRVQDAAMQKAVDTGEPAATGLLRLTQESGQQKGFIVLMPVYRFGMPLTDVASRRQAIIGDTAAVFRGGDMIAKSLSVDSVVMFSQLERYLSISVYASDKVSADALIFHQGVPSQEIVSNAGLEKWFMFSQLHNSYV